MGRTVTTTCGFCHVNCGMLVEVEEGRMVRVRGNPAHPGSGGQLCAKGKASLEWEYSPLRLKAPLLRTREGLKEVSWKEALDFMAHMLGEIRDKYGPQALVRYTGAPVTQETEDAYTQFMAAYGSPNVASAGYLCSMPRAVGHSLVYATRANPDFENARCILIWGANPANTMRLAERGAYGGFGARLLRSFKEAGAIIIVVDPVRSETAALADYWLPVNPGTDIALALAMLRIVVYEGLYDREFVEKWTKGFPELKAHLEPYTLEWAAEKTGLSPEAIREATTVYITRKPATIRDGNGLDMHTTVVQACQLLSILTVITGNLDIKGGNALWAAPRTAYLPTVRPEPPPMGADRYPLYSRSYPSARAVFPAITDAIFTGQPYQPRAMLVHHANPLVTCANTSRVREALKRLDFLIVSDVFPTATAQMAHLVLPDASDFERVGFSFSASTKGAFIAFQGKAVEPLGRARSAFEVEYELAERMGLQASYPFKNTEEWLNYRLSPLELTVADLEREPIRFVTPPHTYRSYEKTGFKTPSGKVELFPEDLRNLGVSPLPHYQDPPETPEGDRKLASRYPLVLLTRKGPSYVHSKGRNLPSLVRKEPEPLLHLHPQDAREKGIKTGDRVKVESPRGSLVLKAKVEVKARPGIAQIDFGWGNPWDSLPNVNDLSPDEPRDPLASSPSARQFLGRIEKVA